jgi:hypothetical protein
VTTLWWWYRYPSGRGATLFSVLTTNHKGAIAEAAVIYECAKLGVAVARPLDDQRYDLIFDLGVQLLRVQCKWAVRNGHVVWIRTRRSRRGPNGMIHRQYSSEEIDAIAAYCSGTETCYLLPHDLSVERTGVSLRLGPTRNNQALGIRWARDYEFGATLTRILGR